MIHEELSGKIIGAGMDVLNELRPRLDDPAAAGLRTRNDDRIETNSPWRAPRSLPTHSARNAIIGSTRLALRAGTQQARSAMPNKSKATHVKVIGSEVLTP
jgi:hypothetical protein